MAQEPEPTPSPAAYSLHNPHKSLSVSAVSSGEVLNALGHQDTPPEKPSGSRRAGTWAIGNEGFMGTYRACMAQMGLLKELKGSRGVYVEV